MKLRLILIQKKLYDLNSVAFQYITKWTIIPAGKLKELNLVSIESNKPIILKRADVCTVNKLQCYSFKTVN